MLQGFLLGVTTGTACLAYCAPALTPLLLGEGRRIRQNWALLAEFLAGRLGGYLLFALLAWATGRLLSLDAGGRDPLFGVAYIGLALVLLAYGLGPRRESCAAAAGGAGRWLSRAPALLPAGLGFLTGLNLCPPFLLAFTDAARTATLTGSLLFFAAFFAGTSLYFLPLPLLGAFHRVEALRVIGKMTAGLMALYYLVMGLLMLWGGN